MSDFSLIAIPLACALIAFVAIPLGVWAGDRRERADLDQRVAEDREVEQLDAIPALDELEALYVRPERKGWVA